jgi:hypothetical protein
VLFEVLFGDGDAMLDGLFIEGRDAGGEEVAGVG